MSGKWQRAAAMGKRPVRIANCSGYHGDPAEEMYRQASLGDIDFITGDYLAGKFTSSAVKVLIKLTYLKEVNMAGNAQAYAAGKHPGWEETAWQGLQQSIEIIAEKGIKVALNGGALNPKGLAEKVANLVRERGLDLKVCFISGDDLRHVLSPTMPKDLKKLPKHLDSDNSSVKQPPERHPFLKHDMPVVSANAYMGARGIVEAFKRGADVIICGRCSDASPVIAGAWYWHSWKETDYNELAGCLVAGHLIECSAYVTGGNFAGFDKFSQDIFVRPGFPIAEVDDDGSCVITKHETTGGMINIDTVRCQLLYELQGNVYLHSDTKAYLDNVTVMEVGKDRVRVVGIRGKPPPPTTKFAIFYRGGYECQLLLNATGYATAQKWDLLERQLREILGESVKDFETLEFQSDRIGVPSINPRTQNSSTTYLRIFAEAATEETLKRVAQALGKISLKHFSGFHSSLDFRTAVPRPFIAYYPAIYPQDSIIEEVIFVNENDQLEKPISAGHPPRYEDLENRVSYDTINPVKFSGSTRQIRLGDIALARSGDKGSNLNFGLFVQTVKQWDWLRSFMSRAQMRRLLGDDDRDEYFIERVEFPHIFAVHFVIYGILGRGVSSSSRLDGFGKGFADFIRDVMVDVPEVVLQDAIC
ncbi:hypothetical protein LOCC1_G007025 [Lachnellula occidentalis]|uniref:DUF1446-domain-containing protein n=1 Tax=Lachnellula occidentalis TaxID=215460 RepID=A0A8H8S4Z1_9HELO|nr:hypothetical protein LOCC1_G007025 [Lachnellula occidentalis]